MAPTRLFGNHPDPMDLWLETQGYYRKLMARDSSCLFRAISEQVYFTQKFHLDVRQRCVEYMRSHLELFDGHNLEEGLDLYLDRVSNPNYWGSSLEIIALSHLYKIDILIFKDIGVPALNASNTVFDRKVMLCFSYDRHYDSVYLKDFSKIAGFCQSLIYEILYKDVFGMKDVDYAVDKMLHYKPPRHRGDSSGTRKFFSYSCNSIQLQRKGMIVDTKVEEGDVDIKELLSKGFTPFPYKVAKSLDPSIYRNVEFDVWIDYRRGLRQGYFGSNNELQVGGKCQVKMDENTYVGHIQEMAPEKGPVVVFVEELGEKRTVPYESLELLPQDSSTKQILCGYSRSTSIKSGSTPDSLSNSKGSKSGFKGKNLQISSAQHGLISSERRRSNSRSDQSSITDNSCDNLSRACMYQESNMLASYGNFPMDGYNPGGFHSYQFKPAAEFGMTLPIQTHVLMSTQQHGGAPIFFPVSPLPEDMPFHWLTTNINSDDASLNQSGEGENSEAENNQETSKDLSGSEIVDDNANYLPDMNIEAPQINFNAPKSVLDDGSDLPMSDLQTLRFFYNLGHDVYRAQCSMQYSWGGFPQPFAMSSPSTPNSPGMCPGKCLCGPVCITTVPTIHHLLEPTTPPSTSKSRKRDDNIEEEENEVDLPCTSPTTSVTTTSSSTPSISSRLKGKGKKKDMKTSEGQPTVHQPTLQIPATEESVMSESQSTETANASSEHNSSAVSIPYSPTYGYVYYPPSPVVPFSPVESDPFFAPLRLQYPTEYTPDSQQSPCFSVPGDMGIYGSSPQFSMMATSSHYLVPTSPGIYVGSPPAWNPLAPANSQQ